MLATLTTYLEILREIRDEVYFDPKWNWPDEYFRIRSYEISAFNDIVTAIKKEWPARTPIDVLGNIYDYYTSLLQSNDDIPREIELILTINCEVAEDIAYYFV